MNSNFAGANPPRGSSGIYGREFKSVLDVFFNGGMHVAQGLSVSTATVPVIDMTLPFNPKTNKYTFMLDSTTIEALIYLPPPCATPQVLDLNTTTNKIYKNLTPAQA